MGAQRFLRERTANRRLRQDTVSCSRIVAVLAMLLLVGCKEDVSEQVGSERPTSTPGADASPSQAAAKMATQHTEGTGRPHNDVVSDTNGTVMSVMPCTAKGKGVWSM
jgi:hypothetical protein